MCLAHPLRGPARQCPFLQCIGLQPDHQLSNGKQRPIYPSTKPDISPDYRWRTPMKTMILSEVVPIRWTVWRLG